MESLSSPKENVDAKATFRKPSNDAGGRIYRRRSPLGGSSSPEGSPIHHRSSSPIPLRKDLEKGAHDRRRKGDRRDLERSSERSNYGRSSDSYRHSDRQFSRSSHSSRHDGYDRRDKYIDDEYRDHSWSSRSGRDSRSHTYSDHSWRDSEYRSKDHPRDADKYSRDKSDGLGERRKNKEREKDSLSEYQKHREKDLSSDRAGSGWRHTNSNSEDVKNGERDRYKEDKVGRNEKIDHQSSTGNHKSDHAPASQRDSTGFHMREVDVKSLDNEKYTKDEKKNSDDRDRNKERYHIESGEPYEDGKGLFSKDQGSSLEKQKLFSLDGVQSNAVVADEKQSFGCKQAREIAGKRSVEQAFLTDSDIDAAKVAAMKAAELVNRNLVGTGYMSADQKKKLLWGNKKATAAEESAKHWDTTIFGDRERQEKFHKLMSLRLHWYLWPIVGCEGRNESGAQTRQRRCGEAEGTAPDGSREAIYCWITSKRWSHCRLRSLNIYWLYLLVCETRFGSTLLYNCSSKKFTDVALECKISSLWLKFFITTTKVFIQS